MLGKAGVVFGCSSYFEAVALLVAVASTVVAGSRGIASRSTRALVLGGRRAGGARCAFGRPFLCCISYKYSRLSRNFSQLQLQCVFLVKDG